jgi:hypothetical protein
MHVAHDPITILPKSVALNMAQIAKHSRQRLDFQFFINALKGH